MAREGYLILDSDLHMMEPDDLWARYLDEPHGEPAALLRRAAATARREHGGQGQRRLRSWAWRCRAWRSRRTPSQQGATASSRELRRRSRARHPHFNVARARGFDAASTLTAMDIEGHRRRGDVRHARPADPVPRRSRARLRRGAGARLQQLGRRLLQDRPAAAQIRRADRDARCRAGGRGGAPLRQRAGRGRGDRHARTRSTASICTTRRASRYGTRSKSSTCRSASIRPATPR